MTATQVRRIFVLSILLVVGLGAIALTGLWHPPAPNESMQMYLPQITLPAVVIGGLVDGINPCAFTVLLLLSPPCWPRSRLARKTCHTYGCACWAWAVSTSPRCW